ncbi:MAG: hypothetical protein ACPGSB_09760, partial [Opitutales bacterium]
MRIFAVEGFSSQLLMMQAVGIPVKSLLNQRKPILHVALWAFAYQFLQMSTSNVIPAPRALDTVERLR